MAKQEIEKIKSLQTIALLANVKLAQSIYGQQLEFVADNEWNDEYDQEMSNIESEVDEIASFYHKDEFKALNKNALVELGKVLTEYWSLFKKCEHIRISEEDIENWDENKYHS